MNKQLQFLKNLYLIFLAFILLCFNSINAQTLNPGDLAVIGWNAITDRVLIVNLVDIPAGTVIKITDKGWDQSNYAFTVSNTGDGIVTWSVTSTVQAGTVLELFLGGSDEVTTLTNLTSSNNLTSNIAILGYTVSDPMPLSGDQVFIYQGLDNNPFFIFGMNNSAGSVDSNNWNNNYESNLAFITLRDSYLPNGFGSLNALTNGINAIGLPGGGDQRDNVQYSGPISVADRATWLARFTNINNWSGSDANDLSNSITTSSTPIVNIASPCVNPNITAHPSNVNSCVGGNATFNVAATGASAYQWQVNTGAGFVNLSNSAPYSGVTTSTLSITGITSGMNGFLYRCVAIESSCETTSNSAELVANLSSTTSQSNVSCFGGSNGTATVNASGGSAPYTYSWAPSGGTAATATGLSAGNYTVTVTDANSCQTTQNFTITQPPALTATAASQTNVSCNGGSNGSATVLVTGGTGTYFYSWVPSGGTGATATGLSAGNYTVTVTDANSCETTQNFTISQPPALTATAASQSNVSCNGGSNGTATVNVSGGVFGYTYSWAPSGGTGATATGLSSGTYTVTVTDANACQTTQSFTITEPSPLQVSFAKTDVSVYGGSNGTATVIATGGTAGYTFSWAPYGGSNATATGLVAGFYTVTVTDANMCSVNQNIEIVEPTELNAEVVQTNVSTFGGADGSASVVPSGGVSPYTIVWDTDPAQYAANISGLVAGTYTATITDNNGHQITREVNITEPEVSTNATLSSLALNNGNLFPSFDPAVLNYTVSVSNAVNSIAVTATLADATATMEINGAPATSAEQTGSIALLPGINSILVDVTAQDGLTTTFYAVEITRGLPIFSGLPASITMEEDARDSDAEVNLGGAQLVGGSGTYSLRITASEGYFDIAASGSNLIVTGHSSAALTLTGTLAEINQYISIPSNIYFIPPADLNGSAAVELDWRIKEAAAEDDQYSNIGQVVINLTAVNDAPVNSVPGTQQVDQNSALVFSSANGNPISVSDVDAGGASIKISLVVTNGVLTLSGTTGLIFTSGTGVNNSTMVFEGSIANINVALEGMVFTPTSGFSGSATLTITSDDQGFSGSGGALTATDEVLINVNIVAPVISSVTVPSDGVYAIGENLDFTLNFSEVVTVNGSPQLSLTIGSTTRQATYISGSGTNALVFRYTVQSEDLDLNGILAGTLSLNGGTIRDLADNNANLTLNAIGSTAQVLVDGVRPTVSSLSLSNTTFAIGQTGTLTVVFSERIIGLETNDFTVFNGTLSGLSSSDGGTTWTATFTPSSNVQQPVNLITLDNTGYTDLAGNAGTGTTDSNNYAIDTQRPTVSITVADDQLTVGETTSVTILFSEAVTGLTLADFSVSNGNLTSLSTNDNITYTATLTPTINTEQATNLITLDNTGYQDVPGNTGIGATDSNNYLVDTRPPLVQTQNITVQLGVDGTASILASQVDNNSIDGFGIASVSVNQTSFDCSDVGPNTLTLTVTDNNGNQATGTAIVTVEDVTGPEVTTQNISIQLDTSGSASINATDLVFESTDACGVSSTTASQTEFDSNDIGENIISVTVTDTNGNSTTATAIVEVLAIDITGITFEDQSFVFDGTEKSLEITGTLPAGASVSYVNNTRTDVGTQEATATISGSNYTTLVLTADLTITPATITGVTFEDGNFVFDGTEKSLEITGTLPAGTSVAYDNNTRTDVGTQEATATISGSNYITLVLTADLTITPATITGVTFEDGSFVYDGTEKSIEINGTLPAGTSVSYVNNTRTDVGTQGATATISGSNYTTLVLTADLTITPATITGVTFEDQSFVFDGTEKSLEITGTLPVGTSVSYVNNTRTDVGTQGATATISGSNYTTLVLTADLNITPATITGITFEDGSFEYDGTEKSIEITGTLPVGTSVAYDNNTRTDVGTQEATATISGSNYTTLVLTADLTITPATITGVTFEDGSFVYDGTEKSIEITGTLPVGTSVAYDSNTRTDVGVQEATATISGSNYTTLVLTADLNITPATITGITFEDQSFVFDGTEKTIEITGTLPAGTSVSYENNTRTNVGTQEATATITGSNYTTLVLTADLTITPGDITSVTFEDQSFVFDGAEKSIEITGTLPVGTSVAYDNNTRTDVGTQEAAATITGSNYTTLVLTADLTITPAVLEINPTLNQGKVYGESDPMLTFTATGFGSGDDEAILTGSIVRVAGEHVGSYAITQGSLDAGANYSILFSTGDFHITQAQLTITATDQTKVYGAANPALTFTYAGLVNDDSKVTTEPSISTTATASSGVGTYPITLAGGSDANYEITLVAGALEVTKATLTITADSQIKPFGVEDPALTYQVSGLVNDDQPATITGSLQRAVGEEPGSYAIGLGSLSAGNNYTINFVSADLTITASEIDMVFQPANVETAWGQEPALPSSIGVMTADGQVLSFPITWNLSPLNIYARGDYALEAVINLSEGYTNPMELMANVTVTVLPKPAPQDLLLDNLSFRADSKNYQIRVGGLSVVDPIDNVHSIELVQGAYESSFFAIINNALYWNTTARVEGKKTFEVLIRVTDRDGNVIEKVFTIERTRESVSAIEIFNSFSPNGDGTNDTWGVPELRYYSGVVIQVFERSGKRLFYTQNPDIKWDGFFETIALPTGTYYWTVEVKETGEVRKGMLNLFRK